MSDLVRPTAEEIVKRPSKDGALEQLTEEEFFRRHASLSEKLWAKLRKNGGTVVGGTSAAVVYFGIPLFGIGMVGYLLLADHRKSEEIIEARMRTYGAARQISASVVGDQLRINDDGETVTLVRDGNEFITPYEQQQRDIKKYGAVMTARP